jgi:hypothetical protein
MIWIKIAIIAFIILETGNIIMMYFLPDSKMGNGVGVFKAWEKSKTDPEIHNFAKYMVNWVAGTKVIFILLLIVFLVWGDDKTLPFVGVAMTLSIATFFFRLFPMMKDMDQKDQVDPKGYSKTLRWMILGMILVFSAATFLAFVS